MQYSAVKCSKLQQLMYFASLYSALHLTALHLCTLLHFTTQFESKLCKKMSNSDSEHRAKIASCGKKEFHVIRTLSKIACQEQYRTEQLSQNLVEENIE